MKEENKIVIDLGYDNLQLIVERNLDPGYNEVFVGLERNGVWVQDLAIVGQQYHYGDDCNVIRRKRDASFGLCGCRKRRLYT